MKTDLRINSRRLKRDFEHLAAIGATDDGGVNRPALSEAHLAARRWFRERVIADGLQFHIDSAGNHSARWPARERNVRTLLLGSHLDSVPYGGCFDGALGVLAAYEVLRTLRDSDLYLPVDLEAIDFTDEEGTFVGLLGSRALAGTLTNTDLSHPRAGKDRFLSALNRAGLSEEGLLSAHRDPTTLAAFLEVHIEQGPLLVAAGADIGIVSSMAGMSSLEVNFIGRADHAGTTPMNARRDAGQAAAAMMVDMRQIVMRDFSESVINFGRISFEPGAYNIVPNSAKIAVEYRSPNAKQMESLENTLLKQLQEIAQRYDVKVDYEPQGHIAPISCAPEVQEAFARTSEFLSLRHIYLSSGAFHDTMSMSTICPSGMILIPSQGGSHSAHEHAEWQDCVHGANTLLLAALHLGMVEESVK